MEIDNDDKGDDKDKSKLSEDNQEILQIERENIAYQKELDLLKNRKKNIHLVCDQVNNWSNKVCNKLNQSFNDTNIQQ